MSAGARTTLGDGPLVMSAPVMQRHRDPISGAEVRAMIDATADAGFAGLSVWTAHHDWATADDMSSADYVAYHRDRGLATPAAEVLLDWADAHRTGVSEPSLAALDVAATIDARYAIATLLEAPASLSDAAASLAVLCDRAAERGLAVSIEFLPVAGIATIADAARMLEAVDRDNVGLVLDAWHWFRQAGGPDVDTLRSIPSERIHVLQLNDAPAKRSDDLVVETMTGRLLPGEGDVDIHGLLDVLDGMGASPLVASEVFSTALAELGAAENARRQFDAASAVLRAHRGSAADDPPTSEDVRRA
jgi:sugar phosphate isomerase/epimerase